MIIFELGPLTLVDLSIALLLNFIAGLVFFIATLLDKTGQPHWIARKTTHILLSSLIALTMYNFTSLSGVLLSIILFLGALSLSLLLGSKLPKIILNIGTREGEKQTDTILAVTLGIVAYGTVLLLYIDRFEIVASSILTVGWGDGAGEVIGRTLGRHKYSIRNHYKTFEGSIGVVLGTQAAIIFSFVIYAPVNPLINIFFPILIVSLIISGVEALCIRWADNFILPLVAALLIAFLVPTL